MWLPCDPASTFSGWRSAQSLVHPNGGRGTVHHVCSTWINEHHLQKLCSNLPCSRIGTGMCDLRGYRALKLGARGQMRRDTTTPCVAVNADLVGAVPVAESFTGNSLSVSLLGCSRSHRSLLTYSSNDASVQFHEKTSSSTFSGLLQGVSSE